MTTQDSPPPIPKQRRPMDRVVILLLLSAMAVIALTLRAGPSLVAYRDQTSIAEAGVTNVVAALVTITEDARVTNLRECFRDPYSLELDTVEQTIESHTDIAYRLLRMGSRAALDLQPFARAGLYQGYIDLGHDPWGEKYYIYFGTLVAPDDALESKGMWNFEDTADTGDAATLPAKSPVADGPPPFVAWPGAHKDGSSPRAVPAPAGLPFYVICAGPNGVLDQPFMNGGVTPDKGDDITSWDGYAWEVVRGNRE